MITYATGPAAGRGAGTLLAPISRPAPGAAFPTVVVVAAGTDVPPPRPERGLWIDRDLRAAAVDDVPLELTYLEFELLSHLASHPLRVHTREALLREVWGYAVDGTGGGRTVDVHVTRLRRKLGPDHRHTIETVRRVGYRYRPIPAIPGPAAGALR